VQSIQWNVLHVVYLFLGGLSAGILFISALATLIRKKEDPNPGLAAVYGAMMAPWPVILGCLILVFDLGIWYRFYKLFMTFQWTSPMSIGSWLLAIFSVISLLYLYAFLTASQRAGLISWLPRALQFQWIKNLDLSSHRRTLALMGLPVSIGVGIYTGVLLGAVQSRPFWNTSLVAQLFGVSAFSTGWAALLLVLSRKRAALDVSETRLLYTLYLLALGGELFIVLPYIIHGQLSVQVVRDSLQLILGGPFTLMFWLFFFGFGLLLPLFIVTREALPILLSGAAKYQSRMSAVTASIFVLAGAFLLRYIFLYAGQMSSFK